MFSSETAPTVFRVLPAFEDFRDELEEIKGKPGFESLIPALNATLKTVNKYHGKAQRSSAQILCICEIITSCFGYAFLTPIIDLDPCFKDEFFKITDDSTGLETVDEEIEGVVNAVVSTRILLVV